MKKTKFVATRRVFWYLHSIKLFATAAAPEPAILYSVSRLEMGIEPNNKGSSSVKVQVITGLQLRIWFGHNCNCKRCTD